MAMYACVARGTKVQKGDLLAEVLVVVCRISWCFVVRVVVLHSNSDGVMNSRLRRYVFFMLD
jgi:hypothetical protein